MEFPITAFSRPPSTTLPVPPISEIGDGAKLKAMIQCENLRGRIGGVRGYSRRYFGVDIHKDILFDSMASKRGVFD